MAEDQGGPPAAQGVPAGASGGNGLRTSGGESGGGEANGFRRRLASLPIPPDLAQRLRQLSSTRSPSPPEAEGRPPLSEAAPPEEQPAPPRLDLRLGTAVVAAKVASAGIRRLGRGGGTATPGLIADRLDPD